MRNLYFKICSSKFYFILFLLLLTLFSSFNLFHSGIIFSHDINFHLHRILALVDNIKIMKYVPVYFNYLNGFGYADGLFYPDLFLFFPAFFKYIGFGIEFSYKFFVFFINFFSIYFMYLCVYRITKSKKCSYFSMLFYSCSIYRLVDLIERGALAEYIVFALLPLVILGIYEILYGDCRKGFFFTIGFSLICFSHVISFYLTSFFLVLIVFLNIKCLRERKRLLYLCFNLFLSCFITSHFWMPLLEQILSGEYSFFSNSQIFSNIIPFYVLFIDFPVTYFFDEWYPNGIGLYCYVGLFYFFKKLVKDRFNVDNMFLFSLFFLGVLSILFSCCSFFWKIDVFYKFFSIIQFPWRFYLFATVFFIVGLCLFIKDVRFNFGLKVCILYVIIVFFTNSFLYSFNVYFHDVKSDGIMMGEYLPSNFNYDLINSFSSDDIKYLRRSNILDVFVLDSKPFVEVPLIYYKGYSACNSFKCFDVFATDNGLVGVRVNGELSSFSVSYTGTFIYNFSFYLSVFGFLLLLFYIYRCYYD